MGLSRLENFLKSVRGNVLYVDPNSLDATDSIENQGNSLTRPFKTIQRALLEASRFSYQRGFNNDRFEKTSIVIYPGEHLIDNRPGWIPEGVDPGNPDIRTFLLRAGVRSENLFPFDGITNFSIETDNNDLYKLNSIYGGVIIPRGVSLVGMDLRKTRIRPKYVPNPENDNIERTSIFRLTGGCFLWNFTIFDANPSGQVFQDYTLNKRLPNYSHNKLTVFEYADGINPVEINDQFLSYSTDRTDLDMYYEKVSIAYGIASGRGINPTFPEPNIDLQAVDGEYKIVGSRGENFVIESIISGDGLSSSDIVTVTLNRPIVGLNVNTAIQIQGVPTPGYNGAYVVLEVVNSTTIKYRTVTAPAVATPNLNGATPTLSVVVDTVNSASPYIFNVSLRSVFGMCGLHADGDKADGFKSIVVAQFTGIGLQKDNNAFIKFNSTTGIYEDRTLVPNLSSDSRSLFKPKYENYHIKASNDAFMQLVSVFAIGFAKQFIVESGGDFSVTNSNSNFGAKALIASGFKRKAFLQDDVGYITHIIPPKQIQSESITLNFDSIDVPLTKTFGNSTSNRLYLYNKNNINNPPENIIDGYRIGSKKDERLSLIFNQGGLSQTVSSKIVMQSFNQIENLSSLKVYDVNVDNNKLPIISNNTISLITNHSLQTGEKIRILSKTGFLPIGLENNQIYYAIRITNNTIKVAKTLNDAIGNISININNTGNLLTVESRVSDKLPGEIGHPIQWDTSLQNWYILVDINENSMYDVIRDSQQSVIGESTSRTFITRTPDDRNLIDTVYRCRYVIPKDSPINARPPIDGFVIQESNTTNGLFETEIQKYFNIDRTSSLNPNNPYELRNFKLIAAASWSNGIATFTSELPHNLSIFSEVEILNVKSAQNLNSLDNKGFNGRFVVTNIIDRKTFSVIIPVNPGSFVDTTRQRNINLPFFKKVRYKNTYTIHKTEEIQEYVPNTRDGIYHLFVVINSISPTINPFNDLKLSQPIENFYPQRNKDNPKSDPNSSISYALPSPIGKVVINSPENSITKEVIERFTLDNNIGIGISNIQSTSENLHTITTSIDHGLNRITKVRLISSGSGYFSEFSEEVVYNAKLVGSSTGEGATVVVRLNNFGGITGISSIRLIDGGSAYQKGEILNVVGIATTSGFAAAQIEVDEIYDNTNTNLKIQGIFNPVTEVYNKEYRVISVVNSRQINTTSLTPIPSIGIGNFDPIDLQSSSLFTTGEASRISNIVYNTISGIATITTSGSNGLKVDNKSIISGFSNNNFNGEFLIRKINSVTSFEIFVGKGFSSPIVNTEQFVNKPGFSANGGNVTTLNEEISGRLISKYGNLVTALSQSIDDNQDVITVNNRQKLDLKLGDYLLIDYEILRIKEDVSGNISVPIKVFRGLLGTSKRPHLINSYVEKIDVLPIEFRRNSVIRASGHTFEYVGYGPGNYSTTLPERQDRSISKSEEILAQSFKLDGGINVYTGMNDAGNFYIGNRRVISTTGREEIFDSPVPTVTGEDPTGSNNFGFDLITPDQARIARSIIVEGGPNNDIISEFDGPLLINNKLTVKNTETNTLSLKGTAEVSRNYSISTVEPDFSANPGDVVFDANPDKRGEIGWVYTTDNKWQKFGLIKDGDTYYGNFEGTFTGFAGGLSGVSDIWTANSVGIHTLSNVGIGTNTALPNFALHIFGGIKANGISEFNSQQLTFNIPSLVDFNALTTRISQSFDVIGVSTFSNNIFVRTTSNDTNGRHLRFVQTDTTIVNDQGYGGIEWEGFDTNNTGVRGYIKGISEGPFGQFALSFATQESGSSNPIESLRLKANGDAVFRTSVIANAVISDNIIGTATGANTIRVTNDTSNVDRYLTFISGTSTSLYDLRTTSNIGLNPSTGNLTTIGNITAVNFIGNLTGTATNANNLFKSIIAGDGLSGGGNLTADRTLSVDATVVRTSGNQTIDGTKTFSAAVVLSTAGTAINHALRADRSILAGDGLSGGGNLTADRTLSVDATVVRTSGNQTIGGTKTFSAAVVLSTAGTTTTHAIRGDRSISSGDGLSGGGNLTADRTLSVDATVVRTSGNQTIGGTKTFSAAVVLSTAGTTTTHAIRGDRSISSGDGLSGGGNLTADRTLSVDATVVRTSGNQTIGGTKTFSDIISGSINGNSTSANQIKTQSSASTSLNFITFVDSNNTDPTNEVLRTSDTIRVNPSNGNLVVSGTVTTNSDEKLKDNIKTIDNALEKVKNLRGVEYDRKDSGEHQIGVIAQEVEKIIPDVVYGDDIKSVAYGNLIGLLIEAIKEQQKEIDELKKKLL
jgi:hypothetical protein